MLFQRTQLYSIQPPIIPTPRNQTPSSDLCGTYSCSDIQSLSVCLSRSPCYVCLPIHTDIHIVCTYRQPGLGPWLRDSWEGDKVGSAQGPAEAKARLKCGKQEKVTLAVLMLQPHRRRQNKREPRLSAFCAPVVPVFMGLVHRNAQPFSLN